ncbi:hypothetical protein CERZMDRAFT_119098, partial [Cercospora zeae-maydis SCOH1-5]
MTSFSDLLNDDHDMLIRSQWPRQEAEILNYLESQTGTMQQLVAQHLPFRPRKCTVAPREDWLRGSFNVCIPVTIDELPRKRVLVRCPFPHRLGSPTLPNTSVEKIRGECATFAWLSVNCPNVPIPQLWGFGLPSGQTFTPLAQCSWMRRTLEWLRRSMCRAFYGTSPWRAFVSARSPARLKTGYIITDFIEQEQGKVLASRWPTNDLACRSRLFRSLANILLDLMKHPLPRIGSFTINDAGEVTLSARPLTAPLALFEAEGIPSDISPSTTYETANAYIDDLLHCHDARLAHQLNAVDNRNDAEGQMATVVLLRALHTHFLERSLRAGPFVMQFTDLNAFNVFVDEECNISAIIDLEWSCALPIEMQQLPFWLSGHESTDFQDSTENDVTYKAVACEFLDILEQENLRRASQSALSFNAAAIIRSSLRKNTHWYLAAVSHPRVAYSFFIYYLQPMFAKWHGYGEGVGAFQDAVMPYYTADAAAFIERKVKEKQEYGDALRALCMDRGKLAL